MNVTSILFIVLIVVAFYFLMIRPQRARQKAQQDLVNTLGPGAEVMTTAGVFGTIRGVENDIVRLEIAPGVEMRIVPAAIAKVIEPPATEPPAIEPPHVD